MMQTIRPFRLLRGGHHLGAAVLLLAAVAGLGGPDLHGQARIEIDAERGRRIVGGIGYQFGVRGGNAVDSARAVMYVMESADPFRVEARSLEDGRVLRTFGSGEGVGPGELLSVAALTATPDGVLATDRHRIHRWDEQGALLKSWAPSLPMVPDVCLLDGDLYIPVLGGVARLTPDGQMFTIPPDATPERFISGMDTEAMSEAANDLATSRITCSEGGAYVQMGSSITAYRPDGRVSEVSLPDLFEEDVRNSRGEPRRGSNAYFHWYNSLSHDPRGRMVLVQSSLNNPDYTALLLDTESGCHSLVVDPADRSDVRQFIGVYRDSALMYEREVVMRELEGRSVRAVTSGAQSIWLRPMHSIGEVPPCPAGSGESRRLKPSIP